MKKLLIPFIYVFSIVFLAISTIFLINKIKLFAETDLSINYVLDNVFSKDVMPVMRVQTDTIIRPYISNKVKVGKYFYDYESNSEKQEDSLIIYENTYFQNTGVDYIEDDIFEVVSVLDGEIIGVENSDVYGNIIVIKHNDNLITRYSNVDDVLVSIGYKVSQGEIIANSSSSKIDNSIKSLLHFEVEYKGQIMDPENLYTLKVSELN